MPANIFKNCLLGDTKDITKDPPVVKPFVEVLFEKDCERASQAIVVAMAIEQAKYLAEKTFNPH
jgi:hypothetical protein